MKPVVFNPVAVDDFEGITHHVAEDNPVAADEVRQAVLDIAERIGEQPGIGVRPRFSSSRYACIRFMPVTGHANCLLFYREASEAVEVLRVLHGARHLPPLFE